MSLVEQNAPKDVRIPLQIEDVNVGSQTVRLVSCEHDPRLTPPYPFGQIAYEISRSSVVFVEYFPHELERMVYQDRLFGNLARDTSIENGIDGFFREISSLCEIYNKPIGVADIANNVPYALNHMVARVLPMISMSGLSQVTLSQFYVGGILGGIMTLGLSLHELLGVGAFSRTRKEWERFFLDMEDARRLFTARGIYDEAQRRPKGVVTYIAPPAHTDRVKWYLQHPDDLFSTAKAHLYSLAPGVPFSSRIYRHSDLSDTWQLVSEMSTRP